MKEVKTAGDQINTLPQDPFHNWIRGFKRQCMRSIVNDLLSHPALSFSLSVPASVAPPPPISLSLSLSQRFAFSLLFSPSPPTSTQSLANSQSSENRVGNFAHGTFS